MTYNDLVTLFSGSSDGFEKFDLEKAIQVAKAMMSRRDVDFTAGDRLIFEKLFSE